MLISRFLSNGRYCSSFIAIRGNFSARRCGIVSGEESGIVVRARMRKSLQVPIEITYIEQAKVAPRIPNSGILGLLFIFRRYTIVM